MKNENPREIANSIAKELDNKSHYQKEEHTFDNSLFFYSTPDLEHKGIMVKVPRYEKGAKLSRKEIRILSMASSGMGKKYKVPELLYSDYKSGIIAEQAIHGETLLKKLVSGNLKETREIAEWLKQFNNIVSSNGSEVLGKTEAYLKFKKFLQLDKDTLSKNGVFSDIQDLVDESALFKIDPQKYLLHGDSSPIHYIEEDGIIYGIDFNGSHMGTKSEEAGNFLGNHYFHMACDYVPEKDILYSISEFVDAYFGGEIPNDLNFHMADSYYKKARTENGDLRKNLLATTKRILKSEEFDESLLIIK